MLKIGLLGGTFDPIHNGHVALANYAYQSAGLDKIVLLVTGEPPHKKHVIASAQQRLHMAQLAVESYPWCEVSDMEIRRKGTTYTFDSLRQCRKLWPDAELFYIVGVDTLGEVHTWYRAAEVAKMTTFLAIRRGGIPSEKEASIRKNFMEDMGGKVHFMPGLDMEVSSSEVRQKLLGGQSTSSLLPEKVAQYIAQHHLYGGEP